MSPQVNVATIKREQTKKKNYGAFHMYSNRTKKIVFGRVIFIPWRAHCEGDHISDGAVESGISPGGDVAVSRVHCKVLERRCNADAGVVSDI